MATGRSPRRDWLFVSFGGQRLLILVSRLIGRAQELFEKVLRAASQAIPKLGASLRGFLARSASIDCLGKERWGFARATSVELPVSAQSRVAR